MKRVAMFSVVLMAFALAANAETVNIEYILDASGSMNELVNSEMKIDVAKKTLTDLVEKLPRDAAEVDLNVGLRIYGHRTGATDDPEIGCKDSALEVPIKGVDVQAVKDKITGLAARGRTPIAYSLLQAKDDFPPAGEGVENIIILVSDGKETCGGDPCATAKELHESGIKVKIHVVGFDIKPDEREQLECIAKAAGGRYYAADSAAGLSEALGRAQEQVLKSESTSVRIKAKGPGKLRLVPASWVGGNPYYFKVLSVPEGKEVLRSSSLDPVALAPGTYALAWKQWQHASRSSNLGVEFEIKSGETTTLRLDTGIHLVPAKWVPGAPYDWALWDAGKRSKVAGASRWGAILAPAGTYELLYRQWQHGSNETCLSKAVTIEKGRCTEFPVNTGIRLVPSDPAAKAPYRWIVRDKETDEKVLDINYKWGPVPIAPGTYTLSLQQTEHGHSLITIVDELPVKEGQLVEIEL